MIYFSELKGKKVYTVDHIEIGTLDDLIFLAVDIPKITKLRIKNNLNGIFNIPSSYLNKINTDIIIEKGYISQPLDENELFVLKNLLDKQIIDLKGKKIVRVNDIALQEMGEEGKIKGLFYIVGVDISFFGILRWFKIDLIVEKLLRNLRIKIDLKFLPWSDIQPLELTRGSVKLKKSQEKLTGIKPEDLADYLERTNITNIKKFLKILENNQEAKVVGNLNITYQTDLFRLYKPEKAAEIVCKIDSDEAVDILLTLSQRRRGEIIKFLPGKKRGEILHLLSLSTTQIGSMITTVFITVKPNDLVRDVMKKIKEETADFSFLTPIYVVNDKDQMIGVFNLHELLLHDFETPVYKFMIQNVVAAHLTTPPAIALNRLLKYRLTAIPVIDENRKLLGIITVITITDFFLGKKA